MGAFYSVTTNAIASLMPKATATASIRTLEGDGYRMDSEDAFSGLDDKTASLTPTPRRIWEQ